MLHHRELDEVKPTHVLNAAGVTGRPNVDWCEDNKETTIRANVIGALNLADLTFLRKIHLTVFATGCIFSYDAAHPIGGPGFTEEDKPNFFGSFYSYTKGMVEQVRTPTQSYGASELTLRIICDDLDYQTVVVVVVIVGCCVYEVNVTPTTFCHLLVLSICSHVRPSIHPQITVDQVLRQRVDLAGAHAHLR
jgi:dTDP-4-dehydrorhamnose reductase